MQIDKNGDNNDYQQYHYYHHYYYYCYLSYNSDHNFDWNYDNFLLKFKGTYLPRVVLLFFFQIPMAEYKEVDFLFPEI